MTKFIVFLLASILFSRAQANPPNFFCFQGNLMASQIFEAGFTDCGPAGRPNGESLRIRGKVCAEPAYCAPDTPALRAAVESLSLKDAKNFAHLTPMEVGNYIMKYDIANQGQTKMAHDSYLICKAEENGSCPHPTRCQEDLLYNVTSVSPVGVMGFTKYPKRSGTSP